MRTESPTCITHPATCAVVLLREDFLAICDANHCAAFILAQMDYWHYIQQQDGEPELWLCKSQLEICSQMLGLYSDKTVRLGFAVLLEKGFLLQRSSPVSALDRTKQFLFVTQAVQGAVDLWSANRTPRAPC